MDLVVGSTFGSKKVECFSFLRLRSLRPISINLVGFQSHFHKKLVAAVYSALVYSSIVLMSGQFLWPVILPKTWFVH